MLCNIHKHTHTFKDLLVVLAGRDRHPHASVTMVHIFIRLGRLVVEGMRSDSNVPVRNTE